MSDSSNKFANYRSVNWIKENINVDVGPMKDDRASKLLSRLILKVPVFEKYLIDEHGYSPEETPSIFKFIMDYWGKVALIHIKTLL